ncbi:MAG: zinc-binding dehydrogenase [Kiritimatiellae bacterium]|nr:zinc-binding dehydrogenase [Kiritimatiellia bacterium]
MKKAVITGARKAEVVEVPTPRAKENWALVRIDTAPMCAEYKQFLKGGKHAFLGHEAAGEVVAIERSDRVKVGDRVVVMPQYPCGRCRLCTAGDYIHCLNTADFAAYTGSEEGRATMAEYLLKPDWLLPAIPDDVSYEHGAMACCGLGPTFGAFERMALTAYDTVLIAGLGPVGLGGVINARYRNACVIGVESNPWRADLARKLGAECVVDPADADALKRIMALTDGRGVDQAVDCAGVAPARRLCIDAVRRRGQFAFVGEGGDFTVNGSQDMIRKGLTLIGAWHYNLNDFPRLMQVIRDCAPLLDRLISHRFPLADIQQAFELQCTGECAKVVLKP